MAGSDGANLRQNIEISKLFKEKWHFVVLNFVKKHFFGRFCVSQTLISFRNNGKNIIFAMSYPRHTIRGGFGWELHNIM